MERLPSSALTLCLFMWWGACPSLWAVPVAASHPLSGSIQPVDTVPSTPSNPHKAYISRATLTADEVAAPIDFEIVLPLQNWSELQQRVAAGKQISAAEMAARFYPSASDYQTVLDWLTQQGFTIQHEDPARVAIFASATVSQLQSRLAMKFGRVTMDSSTYTSATSAPVVPSDIAARLVGINGLQPHLQMHPHSVVRAEVSGVKVLSTSGAGAPYEPSQLAQAYDASSLYTSSVTGTGQTIAIVINTFPSTSDLSTFWSDFGVSRGTATVTQIQAVSGTLASPSGEESLDTEWSSSIAPGANVRVYATKDLAFSHLDAGYQRVYEDIINSPALAIHEMTMSYGAAEYYLSSSQLQTDDQFFTEIAAAGVTIFASSGDAGAAPTSSGAGGGTQATPESPASDPHVTGVGGTSLTVSSSGAESGEVVWNNSYGASGGGISSHFAQPSWQTGTGVLSGSMRQVPDVSCSADPEEGAYVILKGKAYEYGGTSWSSPTWAGFAALLNQARANVSLSTLGLLGPSIYPLIGTSNFRDITSGNNQYETSIGYSAGTGYDLATGIGVPDVAILAKTLTASGTTVPVPNLLSAGSVQSHNGTNYTLSLPLTGTAEVEGRAINGTLNIVCTFDQTMSTGSAQLTEGTGSVGSISYSGKTVTIVLTGIVDQQNLTLTLSSLNGTNGTAQVNLGVLECDVNGDGVVNSQDLVAVRNNVGEEAGDSTFDFEADINLDGYVNSQDLVQVRNHVGDELP